MKVLVITPIYYIKGRENLFHDTNAIHYLLKYWPEDAEIIVVHEYHSSMKQFYRYIKKSERQYLKNGYHFEEDGIGVHMYELPIAPKQKALSGWQKAYMVNRINGLLCRQSFHPDVVICHQPSCYSSQYIEKIKCAAPKIAVLHFSDCKELARNSSYKSVLEDKFDDFFCRSISIREQFKKVGLKNLHEECIQSGVPENTASISKHWRSKKLSVLYAGKLIARKHVDDIIEALHSIEAKRDYEFRVVGSGPESKHLKRYVHDLGMENKVRFIPNVPREKVYGYMGEADIFVMPSTGETLGLVYLEAMRQACIPIGTIGEGIDGIIKNGENGFLTRPTDVKNLRSILSELLNMSAEELEKLSAAAKKTGDIYDENKMGMEYYDLIRSIVERGR